MTKFLDLSEHNTINSYASITTSGLKGVIIKASEGKTFTDSTLEDKYINLKEESNVGFYHYLTITSEPEEQAEHFYNLISNKSMQIVPVLDVEQDQLSTKAEEYTVRFMKKFYKLSGLEMIIYSGRCYIEENFSTEFCSNNDFWVADYSSNDKPIIEKCKNIVAWQYTDNCHNYSFISGGVDCSILYDEDSFFIIENNVYVPFSDVEDIDILGLQRELNEQCFTDLNWNELNEDGIAGELTLSACPLLQKGAYGNITKWVQNRIGINADSIFGEETRQAVITFQENYSLNGDGIIGKNTWRKLLGM